MMLRWVLRYFCHILTGLLTIFRMIQLLCKYLGLSGLGMALCNLFLVRKTWILLCRSWNAEIWVNNNLYFSNTRGYASTITKILAIFPTGPKLQTIPIQGAQLGNFLIGSPQGYQPNLMREFLTINQIEYRDILISKHRYMSNNLMNNIWLRCIIWCFCMS